MNFSKIKKIVATLVLVGVLIVPIFYLSAAEDKKDYGLFQTAKEAYNRPPKDITPQDLLGAIVGVILAVLGIIFLIQVIVAGISWMTAGGNEEKIAKAKQNLIHSVIGLVIVVSAYAIVNFVLNTLLSVVVE